MNKTEVYNKLEELIAEHFCIPVDQVNPQLHFINDLSADSLDTVEIVIFLEEEFDINIDDADAEQIETVQQAADHVFTLLTDQQS